MGPRDPYTNMRALNAAADYVASELRKAGLAVADETFQAEGEVFRNIVGTHAGTVVPQEQVLVVAHYDTKPGTPGADDNASAVAAMLEIARLLARGRFERTLQFVGFTLEEYFIGPNLDRYRSARKDGLPATRAASPICLNVLARHAAAPAIAPHAAAIRNALV